jgi:hypothetical protein
VGKSQTIFVRQENDTVQDVKIQMRWHGYRHALREGPNEMAVILSAVILCVCLKRMAESDLGSGITS